MSVTDRLRATTDAMTEAMRPVRPLILPPGPAGDPGPARLPKARRPRRWPGWLVPVAAAVSIVAVAVALVAVRNLPGVVSREPVSASGTSALASLNGVPRYYVALGNSSQVHSGTGLIVGDAFTGKVLATVPRPAGAAFGGVAGAADDRTFVVNAVTQGSHPSELWYVLRVRPGTADPVRLTKLPIKDQYTDALISGLALSPDGRTLAVMDLANGSNPGLYQQSSKSAANPVKAGPVTLRTYAVPSGHPLRTWTHPWPGVEMPPGWHNWAEMPPGEDNWAGLSWLANGRTLAFEYPLSVWSQLTPKTSGTIRTLDTARPGSDLIAAAHILLKIPAGNACEQGAALLSPDGRTLFCAGGSPPGACKTAGISFSAYSAATGKRESVLYRHVPCFGENPLIAWVGPHNSILGAITGLPAQGHYSISGLMAPGKFTPLKFLHTPKSNSAFSLEPGWIAF